ncbi:MAG: AraC family transcriptional regulator [Burkholderiales bacterium]|nr:AraC family transcriptional regulator [Burkholderiales bacterium]
MIAPQSPATGAALLDAFPLIRSRSAEEACQRVGHVFSPHRLELPGGSCDLDLRHNRVVLGQASLNVLHYGAEVLIDPGERGDFYLVQLPLAGRARVSCEGADAELDDATVGVLRPRTRSRMRWSADCTMLLLQAPSQRVHELLGIVEPRPPGLPARRRQEPEVAAWCQAVLDLSRNIDRFGTQWCAHPAARAAIESFLLTAFAGWLCEPGQAERTPAGPIEARSLRRAKDYIHAHLDRPLSLADIARQACVSPRTLEGVFKRHGEPAPLAYARRQRLQAAHATLQRAAAEGRSQSVTDVALAHGFVHMGRFSAQYRAQFGCLPSQTLNPALALVA